MYESAQVSDDSDRTAFRKSEKKYKLYKKRNDTKKKIKSSFQSQNQTTEVDLSEVLDFKSILESFNLNGETPPGIYELHSDFSRPVFCFKDHPGFYFIPEALSIEEQHHWIRESLGSFPQPPNRTNHNAVYGSIHDLFIASQKQKILTEVETSVRNREPTLNSTAGNLDACMWKFYDETGMTLGRDSRKSIAVTALLRKLRWSTLGLQFDWSKVICLEGTLTIWKQIGASPFLGCKAIFLLGGKSREDPPTAMFLRGGHVVLMAGQARECFHGVPRIFTDNENADITPLVLKFSQQDDLCFMEYIRTSRVNINIRQVF